jgi:hypothetical protein
MPPLPPDAEAEPRGLLWLDVPVEGAPGKRRSYTLGGVLGSVAFRGLTADWLPILAAGRLVHAGSDAAYGFGAYEIAGPSPLAGHPLAPARSFLEAAGLATASAAAAARAAQRAAAEALGPAIDVLLEDCSHAYRNGFSRGGAARALQRAYEEGYRHVLDADIESLFDAVDWPRLEAKLGALFPFEPLVPLLTAWMRSPVVFDGRTIARRRGLPRGNPVSPLLAKLCLDQFDEELLSRDCRLIRYGDDFVVLTKEAETARRARDHARAGWLARVPFRHLRELVASGSPTGRSRRIEAVPRSVASPAS